MKWDYQIINQLDVLSNYSKLELKGVMRRKFQKFGKEGWELVSVDNGVAYFKRPIEKES